MLNDGCNLLLIRHHNLLRKPAFVGHCGAELLLHLREL